MVLSAELWVQAVKLDVYLSCKNISLKRTHQQKIASPSVTLIASQTSGSVG